MRPRDSRLRIVTARVLVAALKRAAFKEDRQTGSHLALVHPDGRWAVVPIHREPLRPGTLRAILRHAKMSPADLGKLL
jgi:predicted RNA binding protein YcfA (HicA-like mRNA interferase family)